MDRAIRNLKTALSAALAGLVLVSVLFLLRGWLGGHFENAETLRCYIASFGPLAPLVLAVIQALQVVVPVLPGFLGCMVGAGMFGAAGGFWCNYIGITAGSILAFLLARRYGMALVKQMVPVDRYASWTAWVNGHRSYTVILLLAFLLPLAPDDFLCYFSGLTGMSARRFTWITVLGKPWCILAYSLVFSCLL